MCNDRHENLFVADSNNHRICLLTSDDHFIRSVLTSEDGVTTTSCLTIDGRGNLWILTSQIESRNKWYRSVFVFVVTNVELLIMHLQNTAWILNNIYCTYCFKKKQISNVRKVIFDKKEKKAEIAILYLNKYYKINSKTNNAESFLFYLLERR